MSIDKQVFVDLIGELETYYKREFTPFVKRVWYKHLSDVLTTVEFQRAVEQALVAKEFMPTPQQLVEAIKGDSTTQANERVGAMCLRCLQGGIWRCRQSDGSGEIRFACSWWGKRVGPDQSG